MSRRLSEFSKKIDDASTIKIIEDDARYLKSLQDQSIDMICTHPPYMASVPYAEYQKLFLWWLGHDPSKLDKELIGGQRGRADTAERFLADMQLSLFQMNRVLKVERYCCIVIGNPVWRNKIWPLNKLVKEIGEKNGLSFVYEIVRGKYKMTMGKMKKEYILIFKKNN